MTKKDFELIARTIRSFDKGWHSLVHQEFSAAMADALRHTNPNFDRERFLKACGFDE